MSQLFKLPLNKKDFYEFIETITTISNDEYVLNNVLYKKANYHNKMEDYFNKIRENYFESKRYYVDRKMTYRSFITVKRQICRYLCIPFKSKIVYSKSSYEISYFIPKMDYDDEENV